MHGLPHSHYFHEFTEDVVFMCWYTYETCQTQTILDFMHVLISFMFLCQKHKKAVEYHTVIVDIHILRCYDLCSGHSCLSLIWDECSQKWYVAMCIHSQEYPANVCFSSEHTNTQVHTYMSDRLAGAIRFFDWQTLLILHLLTTWHANLTALKWQGVLHYYDRVQSLWSFR